MDGQHFKDIKYVHTVAVLEEQRMKGTLDRARRKEEERKKKRKKIIDCDRGTKKKENLSEEIKVHIMT